MHALTIGSTTQELLELVQAGQRIAALRQQALDAPTAQPSTAPAAQTRTHAAAAPAATMAVPSPVPAQQRSTHDVGPGSAQVPLQASPSTSQIPASGGTAGSPQEGCIGLEASASAQEGDADVDEEEGGQEASPGAAGKPAAPSKPMSVMEAALAAFKEEQRKLHKVCKLQTWITEGLQYACLHCIRGRMLHRCKALCAPCLAWTWLGRA